MLSVPKAFTPIVTLSVALTAIVRPPSVEARLALVNSILLPLFIVCVVVPSVISKLVKLYQQLFKYAAVLALDFWAISTFVDVADVPMQIC